MNICDNIIEATEGGRIYTYIQLYVSINNNNNKQLNN